MNANSVPPDVVDDFDIYDDLPELSTGGRSPAQKKDDTEPLKRQIAHLLSEVETLRNSNQSLLAQNKNLSCNISVLYKTAVAEIKRKEETIQNLTRERDNIVFRRGSRKQALFAAESHSSDSSITLEPSRHSLKEKGKEYPEIVNLEPEHNSEKSCKNVPFTDRKGQSSKEVTVAKAIKEVPKKRKVLGNASVDETIHVPQEESRHATQKILNDSDLRVVQPLKKSVFERLGYSETPLAIKEDNCTTLMAHINAQVKGEPCLDKLVIKDKSSQGENVDTRAQSQKKCLFERLGLQEASAKVIVKSEDTTGNRDSFSCTDPSNVKSGLTSPSVKSHSEVEVLVDGAQPASSESPTIPDVKKSIGIAGIKISPAQTESLRGKDARLSPPSIEQLHLVTEDSVSSSSSLAVAKQKLVSEMSSNHLDSSSTVEVIKVVEDLNVKGTGANSALAIESEIAEFLVKIQDGTPPSSLVLVSPKLNVPTEGETSQISEPPLANEEQRTRIPSPTACYSGNSEPTGTFKSPLPDEEPAPLPVLQLSGNEPCVIERDCKPVILFQPPLPKGDPTPLPPLPLSTPPLTPTKSLQTVDDGHTSLKAVSQQEVINDSEPLPELHLAKKMILNKLPVSSSCEPDINSKDSLISGSHCSDENLHMQCPFKPRRRAKCVIVVEDSSDLKNQLPSHNSPFVSVETNPKLNNSKSPDKFKRMPLKKSDVHENRLSSDFRSHQNQRSVYSSRHLSSFKSYAHFPERRSPSELLNGRSGRIDRISHQDKVRVRLHDRRSRSLSPPRNRIRTDGYRTKVIHRGPARDYKRTITDGYVGNTNRIDEAKKPKSLSLRNKCSAQKDKEGLEVKRKMAELFGESSPEPEEKNSKRSRSINAVTEKEQNLKRQESSISTLFQKVSAGSKCTPLVTKLDCEEDIIVVKRRPRSSILLGNSEDVSPIKTDANKTLISKSAEKVSSEPSKNAANVPPVQEKEDAPNSNISTPLCLRKRGSKRYVCDDSETDDKNVHSDSDDVYEPPKSAKRVSKRKPAKKKGRM